jgi:hypothetical protein
LDNGSNSKRRGPTITFTTNSTFGDDDNDEVMVVEGKERHYPPHQHRTGHPYEHLQQEEQQQDPHRPTSPRGPPRIQHWHKQSMSGSDCSSFEVRFLSMDRLIFIAAAFVSFPRRLPNYFYEN